MKRPLPKTPAQWLQEIELAIEDARKSKPFGKMIGVHVTDGNLFHLAPLTCLKFRGRDIRGPEATQVTEVALANYVANSDPEGTDHDLQHRPMMAFVVCYITSHLALDLLTEAEAEKILNYCEAELDE